ncbi:MAG: phosphatidylglycerol lysyltransferase domain-containing protein [Candidatus Poribacteria bacterium]|nr:phosphatidylglycerol lysyltransferase domain-containing protein [Candidatus Poribacteria bacterium]
MRLQPLTLNDTPIFDLRAHRPCTRLSHYAFAPLYVWQEHFQFYWTLLSDYLCIFAKQGDDYFMPILPMPCETGNPTYLNVICQAYQFMLKSNRNRHITRIENVPQKMIVFFQKNGFRATLKETEYLYETEALAGLRGDRYKQQRHAYNGFVAKYPSVKLRPYTAADQGACLALYNRWREMRSAKSDDPIYNAMLDDSQSAHRIGISRANALGLLGRVVRIDGEIRGYTFGYPLNAETFCVLFEITDLGTKGLAQFIYREFCKELMDTYRWINAMDDSGLENLKRVKRSYHPCQLLLSYNIHLTEPQGK